jgi:hypothetical protein
MNEEELQEIAKDWRQDVFDHAEEIDPDNHFVWDGLLIGFLLARKVPLWQALEIAANAPDDEFPI